MSWLDFLKDIVVDGVLQTYRGELELVAGSGVSLTPTDIPGGTPYTGRTRIVVAATGGSGVSGEDWFASAKAATTGALPAYTRTIDTIDANANGAFPSVDGVAIGVGEDFVLQNGASHVDDGVYLLVSAGSAGSPWSASRRSDFASESTVTSQTRIPIEQGATYGGRVLRLAVNDPVVVNVTTLSFALDTGLAPGVSVGQVPRWDGSTWVAGALDLADTDAVTGLLPTANLAYGAGNTVLRVSGDAISAGWAKLSAANLDPAAGVELTQLSFAPTAAQAGRALTATGAGTADWSPAPGACGDADSLVSPDVGGLAWRVLSPDSAPRSVQRIAGDDDAGQRTAWRFNRELNAPPGSCIETVFVAPPGTTAVGLGADVELPSGAVAQTVQLQILDATGHTVLGTLNVTPTGTLARSTVYAFVTAGLEYRARITFASSAQADVLLSGVQVTPSAGATGVFADSYVRIDAENELRDNNERRRSTVRYPTQSAYSYVTFRTTATEIVVEAYNNAGNYLTPPAESFAVLVDGKVHDTADPVVDKLTLTSITLPAGDKLVSVVAGPQVSAGSYEQTPRGTHINAVYASEARADKPDTRDPIVVYGDSKTAGFYSDLPGRDGLVPLLRAAGHRVISEAYGGRSFASDVSTSISQAECEAFARKITRHQPQIVICAIGRNDFTGATFTLANWTSQLGNFCDAVKAVSPRTKIMLVTFTSETTEAANGNGDTWAQWRAAMDSVASTRLAFVRVCRAHCLWTAAQASTYTSDTVHPNSRGYALLASAINAAVPTTRGASPELGEPWPWSPLGMANLHSWYEFSQGLTPTTMGTVTSGGTAPPVLSLSGTPAYPFQLDVAVRVAGTLGVSEFAWSIDGGESWVETDVPTAASYALGTTGITASFAAGTYSADNVYSAGTVVSQADDLSGNANHLVQAGSTKRPVVKYGSLNAAKHHRGLKFDGTNDVLSCTTTLTAPFTILLVASLTDQATVRAWIGGNAAQAIYLYANSGTTMAVNDGLHQIAATVSMGTPHVLTGIFSSTGNINVDGTPPGAAGLMNNHSPTTLYLGGDEGNAQWYADGIAHEMIVLSDADATTIAQCEAYLRAKYGRA